jgi:hypothetical protein
VTAVEAIRIVLTRRELLRGDPAERRASPLFVGIERHVDKLFTPRRSDFNGAEREDAWRIDLEGACGEFALAKWLNVPWSGNLGDLGAADVGPLQVRTRSSHDYDLPLYKASRDDDIYVLVTGVAPYFLIRGWTYARDGKVQSNWKDPKGGRPAYFVEAQDLRSPYDLVDEALVVEWLRQEAVA